MDGAPLKVVLMSATLNEEKMSASAVLRKYRLYLKLVGAAGCADSLQTEKAGWRCNAMKRVVPETRM